MSRILHYRAILEKHIVTSPEFMDSLVPVMAVVIIAGDSLGIGGKLEIKVL